jgi:hypothetical protein
MDALLLPLTIPLIVTVPFGLVPPVNPTNVIFWPTARFSPNLFPTASLIGVPAGLIVSLISW